MKAARVVFGRVPFAMPNLFLPAWQVEGIATWRESQLGRGRIHDGTARRVLDAAARQGRFEPIDRVSGGLVTFPAGDGPYFYGGLFHDYLATRFGPQALERLSDATARWPPFLGFLAFSRVFGATAPQVWRDFEASWTTSSDTSAESARGRRLTYDGFATSSPRWDPTQPGKLWYARRTPHAFPTVVELDVASGRTRDVIEKYHGESLSLRGERLLFDEWEIAHNSALVSRLRLIERPAETVLTVAHGTRAGDGDVSPDGTRAAVVVTAPDRRALAIVALEGAAVPRTLASEAGVYFSGPRWAPDGRRLVAERQRAGQRAEVVLVEVDQGTTTALIPALGTRQATPTWTPDGTTVVLAVAFGAEPFNLVAVSVSDRRLWRVTSRADGARAPDVSSDGQSLAFLGYTVDGEDVFVQGLDRAQWTPIDTLVEPAPPAVEPRAARPSGAPSAYSARHGFVPRYWAPYVDRGGDGVALGGRTSTTDALGRHAVAGGVSIWSYAQGGLGRQLCVHPLDSDDLHDSIERRSAHRRRLPIVAHVVGRHCAAVPLRARLTAAVRRVPRRTAFPRDVVGRPRPSRAQRRPAGVAVREREHVRLFHQSR